MALFFTITLAVSILGMVSLLVLKRYELSSGRIFLASSRPAIGAFFHRGLSWFEYVLPGLLRVGVRRFWGLGRAVAHAWAARAIVRLEHGLEHLLRAVRRTTTPQAPARAGEESAFLREVAEHKKKLQDEPQQGIVLEE